MRMIAASSVACQVANLCKLAAHTLQQDCEAPRPRTERAFQMFLGSTCECVAQALQNALGKIESAQVHVRHTMRETAAGINAEQSQATVQAAVVHESPEVPGLSYLEAIVQAQVSWPAARVTLMCCNACAQMASWPAAILMLMCCNVCAQIACMFSWHRPLHAGKSGRSATASALQLTLLAPVCARADAECTSEGWYEWCTWQTHCTEGFGSQRAAALEFRASGGCQACTSPSHVCNRAGSAHGAPAVGALCLASRFLASTGSSSAPVTAAQGWCQDAIAGEGVQRLAHIAAL